MNTSQGRMLQQGNQQMRPVALTAQFIQYNTPYSLDEYMERLSQEYDLETRLEAIAELISLMSIYPLKDISKIWPIVKDLLHETYSSSVRKTVHRFLLTCVEQPDLTSVERNSFFETMTAHVTGQDTASSLKISISLTNNGRNVQSIESFLGTYLVKLLEISFFDVLEERRNIKKQNLATAKPRYYRDTENSKISPILVHVNDVIRFNSKVFKEEDIDALIKILLAICESTGSKVVMQRATITIDFLITYAAIPKFILASCLKVLCNIYRQLQGLRDTTWTALTNLFRSHMGRLASFELLNILNQKENEADIDTKRGVLHVTRRIMIDEALSGLPLVPIELLLSVMVKCTQANNRKLNVDILQFLLWMLEEETLLNLLEEDHWWNISQVITQCTKCSKQENARPVDNKRVKEAQKVSQKSKSEGYSTSDISRKIFHRLGKFIYVMNTRNQSVLFELFLRFSMLLPDEAAQSLLSLYGKERLINQPEENRENSFEKLFYGIYQNHDRDAEVRANALKVLIDHTSHIFYPTETNELDHYARMVIDTIVQERDGSILRILSAHVTQNLLATSSNLFQYSLGIIRKAVYDNCKKGITNSRSDEISDLAQVPENFSGNRSFMLIQCASKAFVRYLNSNFTRATELYSFLVETVMSNHICVEGRLATCNVLFQLRRNQRGTYYIDTTCEAEGLAKILCRTNETFSNDIMDESPIRQSRQSADSIRHERPAKVDNFGSPTASLSKASSRSSDSLVQVQNRRRKLWMFPGPPILETHCGTLGRSYISNEHLNSDIADSKYQVLDTSIWLKSIISLIEAKDDWEVYSYAIVHLGPQLANKFLFADDLESIKRLRTIICATLNDASFLEPSYISKPRKSDIASCFYSILTVLIGYNSMFKSIELDDMIRTFFIGIGAGDYASKYCIHALTICCFEIPLSLSKLLEPILQKMSQIITQSQVAIDILEFLACLARLDQVYKNSREEEFRMVFGICFRYLQYVRDQNRKISNTLAQQQSRERLRHSGGSHDLKAKVSQDKISKSTITNDDLPQYVFSLAYHVITFWFMALRLSDRPKHMYLIKKNLSYVDEDGQDLLEEQSIVTIDMMGRVAFSDHDQTTYDHNFAQANDGDILQRSWIVGNSLMTIESAGRTGCSQITQRSPSSTRYFMYKPNVTSIPNYQATLAGDTEAESFFAPYHVGFRPENVFQQFYSSLESSVSHSDLARTVISLPMDAGIDRAIANLDRVSTIDSHKVGVIYIGYGQDKEPEILANKTGSQGYKKFVRNLGSLTKLKNASFNTHGLDRNNDTDGEYTICWRDRVTELLFHVTTMMPTDLENDPRCTNKKQHIGNDFINIVYNDSGAQFKFETFPSDFNYVYIVITPEPEVSNMILTSSDYDRSCTRYKVQVLNRPDFPRISFASEAKLISATSLPLFVRLLALNTSVFTQVWLKRDGGEYISSWRIRLREMRTLRRRYSGKSNKEETSSNVPLTHLGADQRGVHSTTLIGNANVREDKLPLRRTSTATFTAIVKD